MALASPLRKAKHESHLRSPFLVRGGPISQSPQLSGGRGFAELERIAKGFAVQPGGRPGLEESAPSHIGDDRRDLGVFVDKPFRINSAVTGAKAQAKHRVTSLVTPLQSRSSPQLGVGALGAVGVRALGVGEKVQPRSNKPGDVFRGGPAHENPGEHRGGSRLARGPPSVAGSLPSLGLASAPVGAPLGVVSASAGTPLPNGPLSRSSKTPEQESTCDGDGVETDASPSMETVKSRSTFSTKKLKGASPAPKAQGSVVQRDGAYVVDGKVVPSRFDDGSAARARSEAMMQSLATLRRVGKKGKRPKSGSAEEGEAGAAGDGATVPPLDLPEQGAAGDDAGQNDEEEGENLLVRILTTLDDTPRGITEQIDQLCDIQEAVIERGGRCEATTHISIRCREVLQAKRDRVERLDECATEADKRENGLVSLEAILALKKTMKEVIHPTVPQYAKDGIHPSHWACKKAEAAVEKAYEDATNQLRDACKASSDGEEIREAKQICLAVGVPAWHPAIMGADNLLKKREDDFRREKQEQEAAAKLAERHAAAKARAAARAKDKDE
mmetsp:Transcript_18074/g.46253  ORF Transcript_18074/g.46253 Transcript_18074/m.46253 type:complete len:557 (-) Transcript_18074:248-1918(-)